MSLLKKLGLRTDLKFPISERVDTKFIVSATQASTGTPQFHILFTYSSDGKSATFPFWIAVSDKTSGICQRYLGSLIGLSEDEKLDTDGWLSVHAYLKREETKELSKDEERTILEGKATIRVEYDSDEKRNNLVYFDTLDSNVEEVAETLNAEAEEGNNTESEDGTVPF